jgi:hypothetical protein
MSVYAGPADWWTDLTDAGRTHIATKGIVQSGLICNYDAGASSSYPGSGSTWFDLSGNGRNLALSNTTFDTDKGGALNFTNNAGAFLSTSFALTSGFTLSVWVKHSTLGTAEVQRYLSLGTNEAAVIRKQATTATRLQTYLINSSGTVRDIQLNNMIVVDTYYNFASTYDGTTFRLYRNAIQVSTLTTSNTLRTPDSILIGSSTEPMKGNIYVVSAYNRALSVDELSQNFNAFRGRFGI